MLPPDTVITLTYLRNTLAATFVQGDSVLAIVLCAMAPFGLAYPERISGTENRSYPRGQAYDAERHASGTIS
jgi:hypothetical protein